MFGGGGAASGSQGTAAAAPAEVQAIGRYSTPEMAAPVAKSTLYLAAMRRLDLGPVFVGSDAGLIATAESFCANGADTSGLANAAGVRQIFDMEPSALRSIFRVMSAYYCPEHLPAIG